MLLNQIIIPRLGLALPELFLTAVVCAILLFGVFVKSAKWIFPTVLVSIIFSIILSIYSAGQGLSFINAVAQYSFSGLFILDSLAVFLKVAVLICLFLTLLISRAEIVARNFKDVEFYAIILLALLGMLVMISANHFVSIYLGLELLSLSLYSLIAINRECRLSIEAAMKYFILGAVASGFLLYGFSLVYGVSGTMDLNLLSAKLQQPHSSEQLTALVFGLVFVVAGLGFKLGVVPFHMWIPDIYQGSYNAITLFLATAPKLAAFAMVLRILGVGLISLSSDWQSMLILLAVMSMGLGNLLAIAQKNIKRMLAYSAISHMGFMVLGLLSGIVGSSSGLQQEAYAASLFYLLIYVIMSLASFGLILLLNLDKIIGEGIDDLKGLSQRSPWLALMLLILMFSMAGVPFFAGFFAKFAVIQATVKAGHLSLAVAAVAFSLIGAFYYLRIVKIIYFDQADSQQTINHKTLPYLIVSLLCILIAVIGLFPQTLINATTTVMRTTLSY